MTQHTSSPPDQQHPAPHPSEKTGRSLDQEHRRAPSGWWIGLLALLPVACYGLPLLIAAGVTAGGGAALGGLSGGVLMLASAAALTIWAMRRRARGTRPADTSRGKPPSREECCGASRAQSETALIPDTGAATMTTTPTPTSTPPDSGPEPRGRSPRRWLTLPLDQAARPGPELGLPHLDARATGVRH